MKNKVLKRIKETGIIAIVRGIERKNIIPLVKALKDGGIDCIEITFNTSSAVEMIMDIKKEFKNEIYVGAGTVTDVKSAIKAFEAGAEFILSPNVHENVISFCKENDVISIPGAYTPTEILMAHTFGADIVKVFPVGAVGSEYIKMVKGPLDNIEMMAVGGVKMENAGEFLEAGCVAVGIGGSLINKEYINSGDFDKIRELARGFVERVQGR